MISLILRFDESSLPKIHQQEALTFLLDMLKEHPGFTLAAADEIEVKGAAGRLVESRK